MDDRIKKEQLPELLAPGGSLDGLKAAIRAGADAVYMGGQRFGARAYAKNPEENELLEALDYCHLHGRKLYLTVNTLLKENELEKELYEYLLPAYERGLDAVLVQDFGVFAFIRKNFPQLPLHASTQMTIMGIHGARLLKRLGAERIVPARELTLEEVRRIHEAVDIEIECFVHGTLCYCYSGQCLMSSMIGGRSGNRGRCAQPCRLPYELYDAGRQNRQAEGYLLSLKDISTLRMLPQLAEAGICSLKIEGRMKRAEYAAGVTAVYRKYLDLYQQKGREGYQVDKEDERILMDLYNRGGFSGGYYEGKTGKAMMAMQRPNHWGTQAAQVISSDQRGLKLKALEPLWEGDALELETDGKAGAGNTGREILLKESIPEGGIFSLQVSSGEINNRKKHIEASRGAAVSKSQRSSAVAFRFPKGTVLARVRSTHLLEELEKKYLKQELAEKIKGKFILKAEKSAILSVTWKKQEREVSAVAQGSVPAPAQSRPLDEETIARQLRKTGNTPFVFEELEIILEDGLFFSMQELNQLRREALEQLEKNILAGLWRSCSSVMDPGLETGKAADTSVGRNHTDGAADTSAWRNNTDEISNTFVWKEKTDRCPTLTASAETLQQLAALAQEPDISDVYADVCMFLERPESVYLEAVELLHASGKRCFLMLPAVWRARTIEAFEAFFTGNCLEHTDGFLLRSNEQLEYLAPYAGKKELRADAGIYTCNHAAREFLEELGIARDTMPLECSRQELKARGCEGSECIVYGYLPLMITAQCLVKNTRGCRKKPGLYWLRDRKKAEFPVKNVCPICTNVIYNSVPLDLLPVSEEVRELSPASYRLAFTIEEKEQVHRIVRAAADEFLSYRETQSAEFITPCGEKKTSYGEKKTPYEERKTPYGNCHMIEKKPRNMSCDDCTGAERQMSPKESASEGRVLRQDTYLQGKEERGAAKESTRGHFKRGVE